MANRFTRSVVWLCGLTGLGLGLLTLTNSFRDNLVTKVSDKCIKILLSTCIYANFRNFQILIKIHQQDIQKINSLLMFLRLQPKVINHCI